MGRGLAAILPETPDQASDLRQLPVELIRPNPDQPRTRFDPESISALSHSIATAGVVQPLIVRPLAGGNYELVAGERRWRAAQEAGLTEVPAVIRDEGESERLQTALIENMAREDLNPVDEARACAALVEDLGLTKEELARRVGRSRAAVSNLIRLLDLPDPALDLLRSGELSEGHGRAILQAKNADARRKLAGDAAKQGWSVRDTERRAQKAAQTNGAKPAARGRRSADEAAAITEAEDLLEEALGRDVRFRATRQGLKGELVFDDLDEVRALAARLRRSR
jgi:ParB family chromosome partitioning protein